jgi:DNA-binding NarL/FixJ family response regulator
MARLRILIAEDHTVVRQGLRRILQEQPGWEVVGEAANGRDAVRQTVRLKPDVAILDIAMPQLGGIEAARQINRRVPNVQIVILSMFSEEAYILRALEAGAHGYLLKDSADEDLVRAVSEIAQGRSFFSPLVARVVLDEHVRHAAEKGATDRYDSLSEREREVFQLMAEGHTNKEIAELLCISPGTVETHRAHIMHKLDLHSRAEAVLYAVRRGVIA